MVAEGVFSSSSSSVHIWRILTGRVSIKEGSTMKKIAGAKGQVGGGQQGERGRNGSRTAAFGGSFVWKRRACVCGVCVCMSLCTYVLLSGATEMRARSLPSHPFSPPFSPFHSHACSFSSPSGSPQHLFLPREPLYRGSACILGKDFTVRGHRLLLSNKQSGTSGCSRTPRPRLLLSPLS